ncbi:hypothetical protein [uncultured Devosia sp.]|uniref:hypothetical protein n=1 Tax=uncultured Devosia sp. TaxID=211434 RepID=UPI002604E77A|nr:hypothetical protein [uncultured Devosia sp.]
MIAMHTPGCASHTGLRCSCFIEERERAYQDARNYGTGFVLLHHDGRIEHIPHGKIIMHTRPNTQED